MSITLHSWSGENIYCEVRQEKERQDYTSIIVHSSGYTEKRYHETEQKAAQYIKRKLKRLV